MNISAIPILLKLIIMSLEGMLCPRGPKKKKHADGANYLGAKFNKIKTDKHHIIMPINSEKLISYRMYYYTE